MSIWVFSCSNESGDRWLEGYFEKELTEEEQHGYFKDHYEYACKDDVDEDDPEDVNGVCYMYWELVELNLKDIPKPLSKEKWSRTL